MQIYSIWSTVKWPVVIYVCLNMVILCYKISLLSNQWLCSVLDKHCRSFDGPWRDRSPLFLADVHIHLDFPFRYAAFLDTLTLILKRGHLITGWCVLQMSGKLRRLMGLHCLLRPVCPNTQGKYGRPRLVKCLYLLATKLKLCFHSSHTES